MQEEHEKDPFTGILVPVDKAEKAFPKARNFLVSHSLRYAVGFREMTRDGKDTLVRYRAGDGARLPTGAGSGRLVAG